LAAWGALTYLSHKSDVVQHFKLEPGEHGVFGAMVAGALLMAFVTWNTKWLITATSLGATAGFLAARFVDRVRLSTVQYAKRREIALFYEAVELYLHAKLPLRYALQLAGYITPRLASAVNTCLGMWSSGPVQALEAMCREINMPEGDLLVSLLTQINQLGLDKIEGVMRREGQNIERLQEATARAKITTRPVYFVIYRILPLVAVFGMFAGVLLWRVRHVLRGAGLSF